MSATQAQQVKVLVIDDNVDAAETLTALLEALGLQAECRTDGQSGILAAQTCLPDFIFLDIGMPVMDGYETAGRLRRIPALQHCKVVALTAWGDAETKCQAAASGFDCHLLKPASVKSLLSVLGLAL